MTSPSLDSRAESLLRELAPRVLGCVVGRYGDFAAAEDAVQEALIAAAVQWPRDGLPENPRGWLIQVASRRMADHSRSEAARRPKRPRLETRSFITPRESRTLRTRIQAMTRFFSCSCVAIPR